VKERNCTGSFIKGENSPGERAAQFHMITATFPNYKKEKKTSVKHAKSAYHNYNRPFQDGFIYFFKLTESTAQVMGITFIHI